MATPLTVADLAGYGPPVLFDPTGRGAGYNAANPERIPTQQYGMPGIALAGVPYRPPAAGPAAPSAPQNPASSVPAFAPGMRDDPLWGDSAGQNLDVGGAGPRQETVEGAPGAPFSKGGMGEMQAGRIGSTIGGLAGLAFGPAGMVAGLAGNAIGTTMDARAASRAAEGWGASFSPNVLSGMAANSLPGMGINALSRAISGHSVAPSIAEQLQSFKESLARSGFVDSTFSGMLDKAGNPLTTGAPYSQVEISAMLTGDKNPNEGGFGAGWADALADKGGSPAESTGTADSKGDVAVGGYGGDTSGWGGDKW